MRNGLQVSRFQNIHCDEKSAFRGLFVKLVLLGAFIVLSVTGCEGARLKALDATMLAVSESVHEQRSAQLMTLLSKSSTNLLLDNLRSLRKVYILTGNLPEPLKTEWRKSLSKGATAEKEDATAFLKELFTPIIKDLAVSENTRSGLLIAETDCDSSSRCRVTTRSGQKFSLSKENDQWRIHLFEKQLQNQLETNRKTIRALELAISRYDERKRIEDFIDAENTKKTGSNR